jgi:peroxiredoxin
VVCKRAIVFLSLFKIIFMKKLIAPAALLAAIIISSFTISFDPLTIGSVLPKADVKLKDVSGKEISLKDAKQKNGLLVMFSCNTCPFVLKNQERTKEICDYAMDKGFGVAVLNSNEAYRSNVDSYADMQSYAKEQSYKWNYLLDTDSEIANAFGANRTPECFLFDKDLKLIYHGAIDNNPSDAGSVTRKHLQIAIDETVEGKAVSTSETKSVGCGIKRKS